MLVPGGAMAGKVSKPYGLRGELNIILEPEAGNHIEPNHPLFIEIDGQRVPFFVEEVELVSNDQAIIKFEFITRLEEARRMTGCIIYFDPAHQPAPPQSGDKLAQVIGYTAFDKETGKLGKVIDYVPHSMNPVFIIDFEGKELIVPAAEDFIEQINTGDQSIQLILPEGLTSL
jgi:16S rRNA processing protein RimM